MKLTLAGLRGTYGEVGKLDRAIVAKRVPILAGVGIIAGELVRDGVIPDGLANSATHWATVAFTVLGVLGGVLWAHQGTTPADPQLQPKDKYGNPLVSALSIGPHAGLSDDDPAPVAALSGPTAADALAAAAAINPQPTLPTPFMEGGTASTTAGTGGTVTYTPGSLASILTTAAPSAGAPPADAADSSTAVNPGLTAEQQAGPEPSDGTP